MKYINKTNAAGIHITESPVDDRLIISTEQEIAILVNKEPMPSVMYDGWLFCRFKRTFIWLESQQGLMATGYTYLSGMMIFKGRTMQESCIILCF
jgi:hypothetical protein